GPPVWSQNGRQMVFSSNVGAVWRLVAARGDGTHWRTIVRTPYDSNRCLIEYEWSPSGKRHLRTNLAAGRPPAGDACRWLAFPRITSIKAMEEIASPDFPEHAAETADVWDAIAEWWDDAIGDGNATQDLLVEPAQERLLDLHPRENVLDIACGAGRFTRRWQRRGARSWQSITRSGSSP